ncbi:MAG TPA: alcohol dehydrogenase catalytic domain-containing protein, partial [Pirellulales bacterium]|nr:alcohol dehydrogenase catalytic domain-containing protein [Pirellulales bacterium]
MITAAAMLFHGPEQPLERVELPVPRLNRGEVLVRVQACTICGSDLHTAHGRRKVAVPTILGHEILGRIVEFGPHAVRYDAADKPLHVDDRVTWAIVANCGECFYCRRGLPAKCERGIKFGHQQLGPDNGLTGGLAEYCVLPQGTSLFRVPDELPDEVACPANCATATVAAVLEAAGSVVERNVLVVGAGMLGLTACSMASLDGASAVVCCDLAATRRQRALDFGATAVASPAERASLVADTTRGYGVDAGLELSGST